jgi:hypothetical protein
MLTLIILIIIVNVYNKKYKIYIKNKIVIIKVYTL